jgi:outer membrane protein assembly factor BamD
MKKYVLALFLVVLPLVSWQCATTGKSSERRTSDEYMKMAQEHIDKEKFLEAKEDLLEARNHYRTGEVDARLLRSLGDVHFELEEFDQAADLYREFLRLHPRHEMVPPVAFKLGEVYLKQISSPNRTLEPARNARDIFSRVIEGYPSSGEAALAAQKLTVIRDLLAEGELVVARFYFKKKNYLGVVGRCETVLGTYSSSSGEEEALHLLGESHRILGNAEKAAESFRLLLERFPDGEYASEARQNLSDGKS